LSVQWQERVAGSGTVPDLFESNQPSIRMASVEGCTYHSDMGILPLKILAPHTPTTSTVVQEVRISFTFLFGINHPSLNEIDFDHLQKCEQN